MRQNLDQKMFHKFSEDATAIPTNNISGGKIAGSVEAGDDPPVRKKKKKNYAYGGHGSRRVWLDYFRKQNGRAN